MYDVVGSFGSTRKRGRILGVTEFHTHNSKAGRQRASLFYNGIDLKKKHLAGLMGELISKNPLQLKYSERGKFIMADEFRIEGCHGTIAEQKDEAFYDDRSDASDDEEKGKIKFPTRLYGREKELDNLKRLYDSKDDSDDSEALNSQVVFLSGYR